MSEQHIPTELKYTKSHEWVKSQADGIFVIGITAHAQSALGDLVHVELPEIGMKCTAGDEIGVVESVKAASDIYAPLSGTVIAVNEALLSQPELINQDPYENGWMMKIESADAAEYAALLDAVDYEDCVKADH